MTPSERAEFIADVAAAIQAVPATLTDDEQRWVRMAIQREAQSIELRKAIIEKTLAGLVWAGHLLETTTKNYGAVAGGSLNIADDGYPAYVIIYNVTTPTTVSLPAISANLPHGFSCTVTSDFASTQNPIVKTNPADGAATLGTIAAGAQRKFVFFSDGVTTGWR